MDYKSLEHITLNQKLYSKKEILELELGKDNHFTKVVYFLKEWFSNSTEIIVKTSGSTGKPKHISIPKQSFVESARTTCKFLNLNKNTEALLCIPVNYIGGKMMVIRALTQGYNLWIEEPNSSPLKEFGSPVDFLAITPMQAQQTLIDSPKKLEQINQVIIGGGAVSQNFITQIKGFKNNIFSTYGMTETVSHIALKRLNGNDQLNYFEVLPSYSISLNEDNCLVIYCPSLFPNKLITNDIAELTDKGFKWLGRKDNIINSGGIKFSPETIENKIKKIYPNLLFYITSKKDETLGEKVVLVTEKKIDIDLNDIGLKRYEIPKEIVIQPIFTTETGKIKREKF